MTIPRRAGPMSGALIALLLVAASSAEAEEIWAGHQLVLGSRSVPILGTLETRSETYLIAKVERDGEEIRLVQKLCKLEIARFAGVRVSFLPEGVLRMPSTSVTFRKKGGTAFEAIPWSTEWNYEDVDGDGKPGATVRVEAPICGGTLYVGSTSRSMARASESKGGLSGEIRVSVAQRIIESSKGCIGLVARNSEEKMGGTFAFVPVPEGSTCESLLKESWPAKAEEPKEAEHAAPKKERRRPPPTLRR